MQARSTDHRSSECDLRFEHNGLRSANQLSRQNWPMVTVSGNWTCRRLGETSSRMKLGGATGGYCRNDPSCMGIWRVAEELMDTACQCLVTGSEGDSGSSSSPGPGSQRPKIAILPRLSASDQSQLTGCIAWLRMVIQPKAGSVSEDQSMMR